MSWKDDVVVGLLTIALEWKKTRDYKSRMRIDCDFSTGITRTEFETSAYQAAAGVKRLNKIDVEGPVVSGTVKSQSGLNTWSFKIDFNDHGQVTGNYWIYSENKDSDIPKFIANRIKESVLNK